MIEHAARNVTVRGLGACSVFRQRQPQELSQRQRLAAPPGDSPPRELVKKWDWLRSVAHDLPRICRCREVSVPFFHNLRADPSKQPTGNMRKQTGKPTARCRAGLYSRSTPHPAGNTAEPEIRRAEGQGFDAWVGLRSLRFSGPVQSTTLPPRRGGAFLLAELWKVSSSSRTTAATSAASSTRSVCESAKTARTNGDTSLPPRISCLSVRHRRDDWLETRDQLATIAT